MKNETMCAYHQDLTESQGVRNSGVGGRSEGEGNMLGTVAAWPGLGLNPFPQKFMDGL